MLSTTVLVFASAALASRLPPVQILSADGVDPAAVREAFADVELDSCLKGAHTGMSFSAVAAATGGAPTVTKDGGPLVVANEPDARRAQRIEIGKCMMDRVAAAAAPLLGGQTASVRLILSAGEAGPYGSLVGKTGTVVPHPKKKPPLTAEQAAQGLRVDPGHTSGIAGDALAAAILAERKALGACYSGPGTGGKVSLSLSWSRKSQDVRPVGHTSDMEATRDCVVGVVQGVEASAVDGAKKSGTASLQLVFAEPEGAEAGN